MSEKECGSGMDWWDDRSLAGKVGIGIGLAVLGVGLFFLYGWLVMSLWNWLMPDLFGLKTMNFWQAVGLPFLIMLLFMGVGSNSNDRKDRKRKRELRRSIQRDSEGDKP